MNDRFCACLFALMLMLPSAALPQGFAGLGTEAEGFALPDPDYRLRFPEDHGPHPAFRIEWWYVTANLTGPDGSDYGIQWTLFRSALKPGEAEGWASPQIWMGHAAATTTEAHYSAERLARGGIGQAGVTAQPFDAWIDDWRMRGQDFDTLRLRAASDDFAYDLSLQAQGPLVLHGRDGHSVKSADGQASHYYSQPAYAVTGTLSLPDGETQVTGTAWLDREWSSQPLSPDQTGWDWFSLGFEDGTRLMAFRLRGGRGDFTSGTWIEANGRATALPDGAIRLQPLERTGPPNRRIPTTWSLVLPERDLDLRIEAMNPDAWMETSFLYWEGPVRISGSHSGKGYLEMTGYGEDDEG
ncbi:Predicted secreted hydrolase [Cribrihabitans marinus]|uniref:Predicted secreted hydrolase n=1 Tax=Cribrihabitans marinus TaxID=1227549 RepID=A0A1H6WEI3_9RHOB|nr:lipocalin-like domain-containing protein [Cribrihabitans marinus]GGH24113.1 iron ABC transporter permease [Cribrihabitans marinus]SEJ15439.1 Predicted secreted hydrolase [Cribrihabitans marinus]